MVPLTQICRKCQEEKPFDCFSRDSEYKSGFEKACKTCRRRDQKIARIKRWQHYQNYHREYRKRSKSIAYEESRREQVSKYLKDRYSKNPQQAREYQLKKTYGISLSDYNSRLNAQGAVCAICHEKEPTGRALAVDHQHSTGHVRGLLCSRCNNGLGCFRENATLFGRAVMYLAINNPMPEVQLPPE